jgi:thiol peroxidase
VTLDSSKGKVCLISVVPSLDTPVCDQQTRRFNEEAAKLPANVEVLMVSVDSPLLRHASAVRPTLTALNSPTTENFLSGRRTAFSSKIKLLARSVFVIDATDRIQYVELVKEVTNHPNYDATLAAAKKTAA